MHQISGGFTNWQFSFDFSHHFLSPIGNLHHFGGFLNSKAKKKKSKTRAFVGVRANGCVKVSQQNCVHRPATESSRDIVVVGAGVAGAALAYTLGKVIFNLFFSASRFSYHELKFCLVAEKRE